MGAERDDATQDAMAFDAEAATRLLHYATGASRQAWASLLERLHQVDGHGWVIVRLEACFGKGVAPGDVPLDRLMAVKESAKVEVASAADAEVQATAWLGYATTVAIAAAFYDLRLSTMPTDAWIEVFSELSALTPEPWAGVFEAAMAGWMG